MDSDRMLGFTLTIIETVSALFVFLLDCLVVLVAALYVLCGVPEPRRLRRYHCRLVTADGRSVPLDELYPPVEPPRAAAASLSHRGGARSGGVPP